MKTLKSLFMLCAGLSFCACSSDNDNVVNQMPEGTGKVVVKILPPASTRALLDATDGQDQETIKLTGTYKITLEAAKGGTTKEIASSSLVADGVEVTFEGVAYPQSVTVKINDDDAVGGYNLYDFEAGELLDPEVAPASIPAYGHADVTTFDVSTQDGVTTYLAEVPMGIPVARLEIGNISLNNNSIFYTLHAAGVYLDNLKGVTSYYYADYGFTTRDEDLEDFRFDGNDDATGTGETYVLGDEVDVDLTTGAVLPEGEKVYAYYFFGVDDKDDNPHFKIYFDESQNEQDVSAVKRWAIIKTFKKNGQEIALQNGGIYRVTAAELLDQNIVGDENNAMEYEVAVEVQEAFWTIYDIDGIWEN